MTMDNGVMKMRPLPSRIKPGNALELKPRSLHILKQPVEKVVAVDVEFTIEAVGRTWRPQARRRHVSKCPI
jgi:copper(I)-binding protein